MDGTSKSALAAIVQLWVLFGVKQNWRVTGVRGFWGSKSKETYTIYCGKLVSQSMLKFGVHAMPENIITNESCAIPDILVNCLILDYNRRWFHYSQPIYKQLQEVGLSTCTKQN